LPGTGIFARRPVAVTDQEHDMPVKLNLGCFLGAALCAAQALAGETITVEQVRQVMAATDLAAEQHDTRGVAACLGRHFYKYVDVSSGTQQATARIGREQYLDFIEEGWARVRDYTYQRKDVVVNVVPDGSMAQSFSTVIETFSVDGRNMKSKVREYARYALEDGRPVIVHIDNQTLVGDTTPP
jgi:hypothetical protein